LALENLRIRSAFSHTSTELTDDVPSLIRTITPPGFGTAFEDGIKGDRLPGSPENQFSLFASYDMPLSNGRELTFNGGYAWQSDVLSRAGGRGDSLTLDSFGIANLSATYRADNWTATLFIDNAFDEFAETGVEQTALFNQTVSGATNRYFKSNVLAPRSMGVRFGIDF
jgi:outer membrane receptor for ferric coprogen and ferric-rhodotorulic acid